MQLSCWIWKVRSLFIRLTLCAVHSKGHTVPDQITVTFSQKSPSVTLIMAK